VRVQKTFKFEYTVVEAVDKGIDNGSRTKTLMEKSTGCRDRLVGETWSDAAIERMRSALLKRLYEGRMTEVSFEILAVFLSQPFFILRNPLIVR